MKLKPSYESQEEIPEGLSDYYVESGGKFVLQVEGVSNIESVGSTIKKERDRAKAAESEAKDLKSKIGKFGDKDIDDVLKELDEIEELRAKAEGAGGDNEDAIQKRIDAAVKRATGPLERDLQSVTKDRDGLAGERDELKGTIHTGKVESSLRDAAQKLKVRQEAVPDILLHGSGFEVAEDGAVVHKETQQAPEVYLSGLKESRPHWWPDAQGAGARGSQGGGGSANPFDLKGSGFSMPEANRMLRESPDKAQQFMRQAGFDDPGKWAAAAGKAKAQQGG